MKIFTILILLLCCAMNASAYDAEIEVLGGNTVVTPQYNLNDTHYLLYNDGTIVYSVYMTDYIGNENNYVNGFVGAIEHDEGIVLNNNASYIVYADYDDIRDYGDADIIIDKAYSNWKIIFYMLLFIIVIFIIYRVIKK